MARRSPPVVNETYETGCTWRMFRIFNFLEGHSNRKLVSNRHLDTLPTVNGNSRSGSDMPRAVHEKYPHIGVSSRRRRDYGCKSISCIENDQVADYGRNEVTKMTIDERLVNNISQGKNGASCQPNQLFDALQILYSNKELFLKLLQDPNSLLVKQIHDSPSSQVKESYQAWLKRMTRLNKSQKSTARQYVKSSKVFDRFDWSTSCKPQSSNRIVVLKPGRVNMKNFADTRFYSNVQIIRPPRFPLGRRRRRLRHVMRVRRKEQQMKAVDEVLSKFRRGSLGLEDSKKVKELEIARRNSLINVHTSIAKRLSSYLDLKKRDKIIKFKDSELCKGQEGASFGERYTKNTNNTSISTSKQNILNIHVESRKVLPQMLNIEVDGSYSSFGQKTKDPPVAIATRNGLPDENLHEHYHIPGDDGAKDSPTQNIDENNTTGKFGSFQDSHLEIQLLYRSPDIASPNPSLCQKLEDNVNIRTRVDDHPSTAESLDEKFTKDDVTNPPIKIFQPDESSSVQVIHDKFEENHLVDLTKSYLDQTNNFKSSKDIQDHVREILQVFSLKWDELAIKSETYDLLLDPSTFDELKEGLSGKLSGGSNFLDCVIETFIEVYHHYSFPFHVSSRNPNVLAYVAKRVLVKEITELVNLHFHPRPSPTTLEQLVEKDLARRGSWLNKKLVTEEIAKEVEEDVLENLVLEIISEMDIIHHILL